MSHGFERMVEDGKRHTRCQDDVKMEVYPDAAFEVWWATTAFLEGVHAELVKAAAWHGWCAREALCVPFSTTPTK